MYDDDVTLVSAKMDSTPSVIQTMVSLVTVSYLGLECYCLGPGLSTYCLGPIMLILI